MFLPFSDEKSLKEFIYFLKYNSISKNMENPLEFVFKWSPLCWELSNEGVIYDFESGGLCGFNLVPILPHWSEWISHMTLYMHANQWRI